MTTDRELERALTDWLEGQPSRAPVDLARSIFTGLEQVPQRARWGSVLRRIPVFSSNASRVAILAGAITVAVVAGAMWLGKPAPVGTSASPSPSAPPSSSLRFLDEGMINIPVANGRYRTIVGSVVPAFAFDLTLPAGWVVTKVTHSEVDTGGPGEGGPWVGFFTVARVYKDPCHPGSGYQGSYLGTANANDLETELSNLQGFDATPATSVRVGGFDARRFTISNSIDTNTAGCTDGPMLPLFMTDDVPDRQAELRTREYSPATNGGTMQHVWIVNREMWGLLIVGESGDQDPIAGLQVVEQIVDSIVIQ